MSSAAQHQIHEPIDIGVLTVIGPELDAALKALALTTRKKDEKTGTIFWTGTVHSQLIKRDYRIVLACVGDAGNPNAAAATTELLANYAPRALLLMGIAAGMRGKTKIGNVALGDRVVASEPAALVQAPDGTDRVEPRPEVDRILHRMEQDVVHYRPEESRLVEIFRNIGGEIPTPRSEQQEKDFASHVAATITTQRSTIAAGEKLLRNPDKMDELRKLHGKIEVIEMEAAGFVAACRRYNALWLVVRGISDFGDQFKDDRFHKFASNAAAAVLADFIAHGLDLGPASPPPGWEAAKRTSEQWLEETRDVIGSGVHLPRHDIEQSVIKSIDDARVTVLVGDSGSGKSALVKAIVGRFESCDGVLCLPAQEAARLVTSYDLPAALKAYRPCKRMLFVLDGLDRASTEEIRHVAAALRALDLSSEASPWRLLITCQSAPWQQANQALMSFEVPLTKVRSISIESFDDSELKQIATEVEIIAPILLRDDLRPVMGRPKVLDLLACSAAQVGAPDVSQWAGESSLIEWAWENFIRGGGRGDQHARLLQRIATRQADERLFAIPLSEFDAPDAVLISDMARLGILSPERVNANETASSKVL